MEVGLHRLAKRFRVKGLSADSWGKTLGKIDVKLDARKKAGGRAKQSAVKYDAILGYFKSAKDGWRDRVCHSNITYTEAQARSIFTATARFMAELAVLF
jgi:2',3'-cyclic-nucleotide 2'-phosphodiesterase (5'-nucleotidase family)